MNTINKDHPVTHLYSSPTRTKKLIESRTSTTAMTTTSTPLSTRNCGGDTSNATTSAARTTTITTTINTPSGQLRGITSCPIAGYGGSGVVSSCTSKERNVGGKEKTTTTITSSSSNQSVLTTTSNRSNTTTSNRSHSNNNTNNSSINNNNSISNMYPSSLSNRLYRAPQPAIRKYQNSTTTATNSNYSYSSTPKKQQQQQKVIIVEHFDDHHDNNNNQDDNGGGCVAGTVPLLDPNQDCSQPPISTTTRRRRNRMDPPPQSQQLDRQSSDRSLSFEALMIPPVRTLSPRTNNNNLHSHQSERILPVYPDPSFLLTSTNHSSHNNINSMNDCCVSLSSRKSHRTTRSSNSSTRRTNNTITKNQSNNSNKNNNNLIQKSMLQQRYNVNPKTHLSPSHRQPSTNQNRIGTVGATSLLGHHSQRSFLHHHDSDQYLNTNHVDDDDDDEEDDNNNDTDQDDSDYDDSNNNETMDRSSRYSYQSDILLVENGSRPYHHYQNQNYNTKNKKVFKKNNTSRTVSTNTNTTPALSSKNNNNNQQQPLYKSWLKTIRKLQRQPTNIRPYPSSSASVSTTATTVTVPSGSVLPSNHHHTSTTFPSSSILYRYLPLRFHCYIRNWNQYHLCCPNRIPSNHHNQQHTYSSNCYNHYQHGCSKRSTWMDSTGGGSYGNNKYGYIGSTTTWNSPLPYIVVMVTIGLFLFLGKIIYESQRTIHAHQQQIQEYDVERAHILEQMTWIDRAAKRVHNNNKFDHFYNPYANSPNHNPLDNNNNNNEDPTNNNNNPNKPIRRHNMDVSDHVLLLGKTFGETHNHDSRESTYLEDHGHYPLQNELENTQKTLDMVREEMEQLHVNIQSNARERIRKQFGNQPMQISIPIYPDARAAAGMEGGGSNVGTETINDNDTNNNVQHLIIALWDDTPHAASTLLQQINDHLWDEVDLQRIETSRIQNTIEKYNENNKEQQHKHDHRMEYIQIAPKAPSVHVSPSLEFVESSRSCHRPGAVAIHQLESDEFRIAVLKIHIGNDINQQDKHHMNRIEQNHNGNNNNVPTDDGDVCIGTVISGLEILLSRLEKIPIIHQENDDDNDDLKLLEQQQLEEEEELTQPLLSPIHNQLDETIHPIHPDNIQRTRDQKESSDFLLDEDENEEEMEFEGFKRHDDLIVDQNNE